MQWLTAILAFSTTMLIFSIVVSTIVETIHRALGSRTFGLIAMLEHFYDDVIKGFITEKDFTRDDFVIQMIRVRGPAVSDGNGGETLTEGSFKELIKLVPRFLRRAYCVLNGTSKVAARLGNSDWRMLSNLPNETFMERLGSSKFSKMLIDKNVEGKEKDQVLKDIAQKFESYGQESSLYFERKARSISVIVAMFVAWTFYVHPYDLIQSYLKNPEIAAKVSELSDGALERYDELEKAAQKLREETKKSPDTSKLTKEELGTLLNKIKENLEDGKKQKDLLAQADAPIGWPDETKSFTLFGLEIPRPESAKDIFWLFLGGLLIGLGAPFWAKTIRSLTQTQGISKNITSILKPHVQSEPAAQQGVSASDDTPVTTEAFTTAAAAATAKNK